MDLTDIAAIILSISGVLVAINNIYKFVSSAVRKPRQEFKVLMEEIFEEQWIEHSKGMGRQITDAQDDLEYVLKIIRIFIATDIERIYLTRVSKGEITTFEQETINNYFEIYQNLEGNGHIKHLVDKMHNWTVIADDRKEI